MTDEREQRPPETDKTSSPEPIRAVLDALAKLRFGPIELTVHEGKLVQIDVTERRRFT
jgi:hypothetical protein